jgi:hypothetical protein
VSCLGVPTFPDRQVLGGQESFFWGCYPLQFEPKVSRMRLHDRSPLPEGRAVVMRPWRNWIAHRSSEPRVEGSNPSGRTRLILRTLGIPASSRMERFSLAMFRSLKSPMFWAFLNFWSRLAALSLFLPRAIFPNIASV